MILPYYKCTQCNREIAGTLPINESEVTRNLPRFCPSCSADNMGWIESFKTPDEQPVKVQYCDEDGIPFQSEDSPSWPH